MTQQETHTVLLPWLEACPYVLQSTYLSALRGPDHAHCHQVKRITKTLRAISQRDGKPGSNYMAVRDDVDWRQLERELEYCTLHYVAHLVAALAIVRDYNPEYHAWAQQHLAWFADTYHLASAR